MDTDNNNVVPQADEVKEEDTMTPETPVEGGEAAPEAPAAE